jgi:very-short-patch-repair endonuclease
MEGEETAMQNATVIHARELRRGMTAPELKLWRELRLRPDGLKFRRQHPVGPYVLDFYCPAARVAIEVDGAVHSMGTSRAGMTNGPDGLPRRAFASSALPRGCVARILMQLIG